MQPRGYLSALTVEAHTFCFLHLTRVVCMVCLPIIRNGWSMISTLCTLPVTFKTLASIKHYNLIGLYWVLLIQLHHRKHLNNFSLFKVGYIRIYMRGKLKIPTARQSSYCAILMDQNVNGLQFTRCIMVARPNRCWRHWIFSCQKYVVERCHLGFN